MKLFLINSRTKFKKILNHSPATLSKGFQLKTVFFAVKRLNSISVKKFFFLNFDKSSCSEKARTVWSHSRDTQNVLKFIKKIKFKVNFLKDYRQLDLKFMIQYFFFFGFMKFIKLSS